MQNILNIIRRQYAQLSRIEKQIADFILASPEQAQNLSISDLAHACDVGESSIFRFCKDIGESGYHSFRSHLMQTVAVASERLTDDTLLASLSMTDDPVVLSDKILKKHIAILKETSALMVTDSLTSAVEMLLSARHVNLVGAGESMPMAMAAKERFGRIRPGIVFTSDEHIQLMRCSLMGPEDVMFGISSSGEEREVLEAAEQATQCGAAIIGITRSRNTSFGKQCQIVLECCMYDELMLDSRLAAQTAQLLLLDVLYAHAYIHASQTAN